MGVGWNNLGSDAGGHGKVRDGGDTIDEQAGDVEGSVAVGDALGKDGDEDEAGGHDTEDDPEVSDTSGSGLLRAVDECK